MLRARQSSYVINNVDVGKTDLGNTVGYEECLDYVEKDDYDQIPADRDTVNHDYLVLTSTVKEEINQSNHVIHHQDKPPDSKVHQTKQSVLRQIFLIMLCIIITASVTAIVTFFATKQVLSENNGKYKADVTRCNTTCCNSTRDASCTVPCSQESCENGGTCVNDDCMCDDGFAGVKCEIDVNQTCKSDANRLIPHPNTCQLYYNCSQAVSPIPKWYRLYTHIPQVLRPAYLHECPSFSQQQLCPVRIIQT